VSLDRGATHDQSLGYLLVGQPLGDEVDHL
jgi:hypothetical protein